MQDSVSCLQYFNDWQIVCGQTDGSLSVWDLRTYKNLKTVKNVHAVKYDEGVQCLLIEEGETILSGGADGTMKVFK